MAKIYSLKLERMRRQLAYGYGVPLKRVKLVKDREAFYIIDEGEFTTAILYNDGSKIDKLIEFDGRLSIEEIDDVLEELKEEKEQHDLNIEFSCESPSFANSNTFKDVVDHFRKFTNGLPDLDN